MLFGSFVHFEARRLVAVLFSQGFVYDFLALFVALRWSRCWLRFRLRVLSFCCSRLVNEGNFLAVLRSSDLAFSAVVLDRLGLQHVSFQLKLQLYDFLRVSLRLHLLDLLFALLYVTLDALRCVHRLLRNAILLFKFLLVGETLPYSSPLLVCFVFLDPLLECLSVNALERRLVDPLLGGSGSFRLLSLFLSLVVVFLRVASEAIE